MGDLKSNLAPGLRYLLRTDLLVSDETGKRQATVPSTENDFLVPGSLVSGWGIGLSEETGKGQATLAYLRTDRRETCLSLKRTASVKGRQDSGLSREKRLSPWLSAFSKRLDLVKG